MLGFHPREQLSLFGCALGKKREQEFVLSGVVGVQKPKHLAEIVGKTPSPLSVSVAYRSELTWGVSEGPFERIVHCKHVAGIGQYLVINRHWFPPCAPNLGAPRKLVS